MVIEAGGQREREREREKSIFYGFVLARVKLHLRCFGFFLWGANFGVFFSKFRSSSSKSKVFPEKSNHKVFSM